MRAELESNGVDIRIRCLVEGLEISPDRQVQGVWVNGRLIRANSVFSNANIKTTILRLAGREHFDREFVEETEAVRLNNSSCQVYIGLKPGVGFDNCGDLLFHSEHEGFNIFLPSMI